MEKRGNKKANSRLHLDNTNQLLKCKRSQQLFGMPFSVIFSIILIVAILVVAFYVIGKFLDFQRCAEAGTFLNDLDKAVKEAYESSSYDTGDKPFTRPLPSGVKQVCIVDLSKEGSTEEERAMIEELNRYANLDSNVFLYPPREACSEGRSRHINYIEEKPFYCFNVNDGKVQIRIKREYTGKVQLLKE
jgi:hypothetical protein